ncbi:basic salivary proline-rich protein 2-like [Acinonyx jubatus]|uniref:Basic salivary proline-rich protein 2-like n=1 Tax=Acinonyx jubatus TaxID=32536 RepID=A0ABM3PX69_ACIJB|nr:basic salivary proline-rich protein 2-like [Acinonyx jubatus]
MQPGRGNREALGSNTVTEPEEGKEKGGFQKKAGLTERPLSFPTSPSPTQGPRPQPTLAPRAQPHPEPEACRSAPRSRRPKPVLSARSAPRGPGIAPRSLERSRPQAPCPPAPASRRPAATALPRPGRALRGPGQPQRAARAAPGRMERPPLRSGPACRRTYPPPPRRSRSRREPGEGREEPGGAGRSREEPEPPSKPVGRGAGRRPLPRRSLEGRRGGGAPPPPIPRAPRLRPISAVRGRAEGCGKPMGAGPAASTSQW